MVRNVFKRQWPVRNTSLAIFALGGCAAIAMAITSPSPARVPWLIVAVFCGGCLFDMLRDKSGSTP